jgi:carbonic anhydrase
MKRIIGGVVRFQEEVYPRLASRFSELATKQEPEALFITCADSRVVPDVITQTSPGDLFICRNVGNIVPAHGDSTGGVSATIEYAVTVLRIQDIIICGHSDCGAMKAVLRPETVADLPAVANWVRYGEAARRIVLEKYADLSDQERLRKLTEENVRAQILNLRTHPSVAAALARERLKIHGWVYDIPSGHIDVYDEIAGLFRPLGHTETTAAPQPRHVEVI